MVYDSLVEFLSLFKPKENAQKQTPAQKRKLSRRDFLKLALAAAGAAVLAGCDTSSPSSLQPSEHPEPTPTATHPPKEYLQQVFPTKEFMRSQRIHDVEVFGLGNEPIVREDQISELYEYIDRRFDEQVRNEPDVEHMKPEVRYLEVSVRRSAYESFEQRKAETGVDFIEWIKIHVDLLNTCLENAQPPCRMRAELRRIIVVDDTATASFWNEEAFLLDAKNGALDWAWLNRFKGNKPKDIDAFWATAHDYRTPDRMNTSWSYFHDGDGSLVLVSRPAEGKERRYTYPAKQDALQGKDNVWIDMALLHEWSHYLIHCPDQYLFDAEGDLRPSRFLDFHFITGKSFMDPYLSAYLSMYAEHNVRKGKDHFLFFRDYSDRPETISFAIQDFYGQTQQIAIHKEADPGASAADFYAQTYGTREEQDFGYKKKKKLSLTATQLADGPTITLADSLFDTEKRAAHIWLIKATVKGADGGEYVRELFFPAALLQMSKFAGLNEAQFDIQFSYDNPDKKHLVLDVVHFSELEQFKAEKMKNNETVYAQAVIPGTDVVAMWFLLDKKP